MGEEVTKRVETITIQDEEGPPSKKIKKGPSKQLTLMDMVTSPKASPKTSPKAPAFKMSPVASIKPTAVKTPPHKPRLSLKKNTPKGKSFAKIDTTPVKSAVTPPDPPKPCDPEGDVDMIEIDKEKSSPAKDEVEDVFQSKKVVTPRGVKRKTKSSEQSNEVALPETPVVPKTPKTPKAPTPKQKLLQEEKEKKKAEREEALRLKREEMMEKKRKVDEEKAEKLRKIEEDKMKKEAERLRKEEEKKKREEAKEEEKRKKEEDRAAKEDERNALAEQKKKKEEEREYERKKRSELESEKKKQESEEAEKKKKEREKFKSFFKKAAPVVKAVPVATEGKFRDFVVFPNMTVAPLTRVALVEEIQYNSAEWGESRAHIQQWIRDVKGKERIQTKSDELEIVSSHGGKTRVSVRPKLLKFHENYRPPYYGSYSKKSKLISARRPFAQDKALFDYDYNSDDDWEEEEEGEDIGSDKEEDKEDKEDEKDEEDEEDGFCVPHGYLSDDEGDEETELTEEQRKKRTEERKKAWEEEVRSKKGGVLRAKIIGPIWSTVGEESPLSKYSACWLCEGDVDPFAREHPRATVEPEQETDNGNNKPQELPIEGYAALIKFMHGSPIGLSRAVKEFQNSWYQDSSRCKVSKRQLSQLIPAIMKKAMRPGSFKLCWYADDDTLTKYSMSELIGLHSELPEIQYQPPPQVIPAKPQNTLLKFASQEQGPSLLKFPLQPSQQPVPVQPQPTAGTLHKFANPVQPLPQPTAGTLHKFANPASANKENTLFKFRSEGAGKPIEVKSTQAKPARRVNLMPVNSAAGAVQRTAGDQKPTTNVLVHNMRPTSGPIELSNVLKNIKHIQALSNKAKAGPIPDQGTSRSTQNEAVEVVPKQPLAARIEAARIASNCVVNDVERIDID